MIGLLLLLQLTSVTNIGTCGYSNGNCSVVSDVSTFCTTPALKPLTYNGGLVGLPAGYTGYYALAMYWAPSSCLPKTNPSPGGFCSPYTYVSAACSWRGAGLRSLDVCRGLASRRHVMEMHGCLPLGPDPYAWNHLHMPAGFPSGGDIWRQDHAAARPLA